MGHGDSKETGSMVGPAPNAEMDSPLAALLRDGEASDDLRHRIVEMSDAWNVARLDALLADLEALEGGSAMIAARARRSGEIATAALVNVQAHIGRERV